MSAHYASTNPAGSGSSTDIHVDNTFGIELEFFLIYQCDRLEEDRGAYAAVAEVLNRHQIACRDESNTNSMYYNVPTAPVEQTDTQRYAIWRVTEDYHALTEEQSRVWKECLEHDPQLQSDGDGYYISSIELVSRKFRYHQDSWEAEIRQALVAIYALEQSPDFKLITNEECGFHVHVGNSVSRVPLDTAKELAKFVTAFEPQIEALHATHRVASFDHYCMNKSPLYMNLANAHFLLGVNALTMQGWLQRIDGCTSFAQLASVFSFPGPNQGWVSDGKQSAYSFDQLFVDRMQRRTRIINTIEFRQHAGTLDLSTILNWVHVVQAIFMTAQYKDFDQVVAASRSAGSQWSTIEMLRHIEVAPEVIMWYNAKLDPSSDFIVRHHDAQALRFQFTKMYDFFETLIGPDMVAMDPEEVAVAIHEKRKMWLRDLKRRAGGRATDADLAEAMKP